MKVASRKFDSLYNHIADNQENTCSGEICLVDPEGSSWSTPTFYIYIVGPDTEYEISLRADRVFAAESSPR
jgi:hypothetical protein